MRFLTTHQLAQSTGEHHTLIRVRNLQTTLPIGTDAWGRPGKLQPVLISASVSLRQNFQSASESDTVTGSTVHYGILSKAILDICKREESKAQSVGDLLGKLFMGLTGWKHSNFSDDSKSADPILVPEILKSLEIQVLLPKASLIGCGASLTWTIDYEKGQQDLGWSRVLKLHGLRVQTLIGVNPNERLAKQIVVASIEIDCWGGKLDKDVYCPLEDIVVKTIEESSFQTLEALASQLATRVIAYFIIPRMPDSDEGYPRLRITLEKPTAVMFADAPMIEVLIDSNPATNSAVKQLWEERIERRVPTFPLEGRLDEWISRK